MKGDYLQDTFSSPSKRAVTHTHKRANFTGIFKYLLVLSCLHSSVLSYSADTHGLLIIPLRLFFSRSRDDDDDELSSSPGLHTKKTPNVSD